MQPIKVAFLKQTSYQEMIHFFLKEADHFSVSAVGDQQAETLVIIPSLPERLNTQVMTKESTHLLSKNKHNLLSPVDRQKLYEVKRIIEQHFLQDHTIASLCRQVGINEFKLKSGFKALFNTRVIQYVRQMRMEYAQQLLRNTDTRIAEVSRQLGFSYPNHFSAAYKRYFGKLPSQR